MNYINIHKHGPAVAGEFGIENMYKNFDHSPAFYFSAGLHPWYINKETWKSELEKLKHVAGNKKLLAIGECGLDRICKTEYEFQKEVFIEQIKLANAINKPLIIHCVRAHDDVMQLLKNEQNKVPAIFHGFNKSQELANVIISKGYYLSFGKDLFKTHLKPVFASIPLEHIFLETDDSNNSIADIYEIASVIKNISPEELSLQLQHTIEKVFKIQI